MISFSQNLHQRWYPLAFLQTYLHWGQSLSSPCLQWGQSFHSPFFCLFSSNIHADKTFFGSLWVHMDIWQKVCWIVYVISPAGYMSLTAATARTESVYGAKADGMLELHWHLIWNDNGLDWRILGNIKTWTKLCVCMLEGSCRWTGWLHFNWQNVTMVR